MNFHLGSLKRILLPLAVIAASLSFQGAALATTPVLNTTVISGNESINWSANRLFTYSNGTASDGYFVSVVMFGTNGTASPSEVISLGYNRAWINSQMIALANATTTSAGLPYDPSFIANENYPISSQRFWILYSDVEDITAANQFGLFSSSNTTAMDNSDPSESQFVWTVPVGYDGAPPIDLTTNDINQAGYGTYNGTGLTGTVRTAAAPTALYWDASSTGVDLGGTGTWNATSTLWTTNPGGVSGATGPYAWGTTSGTDYYAGAGLTAHFTGTAGTVTVGGTVDTYNGLNFDPTTGNTYTLTSGTINLAGSSPSANAITVATGDSAIISTILAGSNGMTKNGTGTVRLDGANTYSGATTINAGTLQANVANALQNTSSITVNNGGSLLISANNAVGDATNLILHSGNTSAGLVLSGNSRSDVLGALTLSSNSVIDMGTGTGNVWLSFDYLTSVLDSTKQLNIWNYEFGVDHIYFHGNTTNIAGSLSFVNFYSGAGTGFLSNGFLSGPELHSAVVPEPEVYATAALLLLGLGIHLYRQRRAKASPVAA